MGIVEVKSRHEERLLQLPNVVGVGLGSLAGHAVIKVFVSRKLPASHLLPHEVIPKEIDGYRTDVEEIGQVTAQTD